ncbi:PAAR domain-containing protein [Paraburkholderia kirstenboschensis]|uniref:PAAR domain-containing protein n=1 Tax=Paraburkholderia kirstenboschensis TaxID=1245436 RepID=UPI000FFB9B72|nr:PAAR domain-containing protein [Paraburkholderia kirstenboschensis]
MIDLIRLGDTTDHGGEVVTASNRMRLRGTPVARIGDQVSCPQHPDTSPNFIVEGDQSFKDCGIPVARQGHRTTCGCTLISTIR